MRKAIADAPPVEPLRGVQVPQALLAVQPVAHRPVLEGFLQHRQRGGQQAFAHGVLQFEKAMEDLIKQAHPGGVCLNAGPGVWGTLTPIHQRRPQCRRMTLTFPTGSGQTRGGCHARASSMPCALAAWTISRSSA